MTNAQQAYDGVIAEKRGQYTEAVESDNAEKREDRLVEIEVYASTSNKVWIKNKDSPINKKPLFAQEHP